MQNNINRDIYLLDIKSNLPKKPNANVTENQIISLKHMSHSEGQSEGQTESQTINQTECQTEG